MKKHIFFYVLAAMLAIGLARPLMKGGSRTGSLSGEVTDPSGAVVPGAKILVSRDHWSRNLSTGETGQYAITGLAPGRYEVTVSANGFSPFDRAGLLVSAGHRTEMDAILDLTILKQAITVTADASLAHLSPGHTVAPEHPGH